MVFADSAQAFSAARYASKAEVELLLHNIQRPSAGDLYQITGLL